MNESLKSATFVIFLSTITLIGYSIGLLSAPPENLPKIMKSAVLPIETAETPALAQVNYGAANPINNNPLQAPQGVNAAAIDSGAVEISDYAFNDGSGQGAQSVIGAGKIVNVVDLKQQDKRFVTLDNPVTDESEGAALPDDYDNPLSGPEIEVPQGATFGVIENGEKITLSGEDTAPVALELAKKKKKAPTDPYAPRTPLTSAPLPEYRMERNGLKLPHSPAGKPALYRAYAGKSKMSSRNQSVAFILGGLGMDNALDERVIKTLPPEVTLGFIPYAPDLQKKINLARKYGHEVILELPAEPFDHPRPDTGPDVLLTGQSPEALRSRLDMLLAKTSGYAGVMNYLGGKFFTDKASVTELTKNLKDYGLYLLENPAVSMSTGQNAAKEIGAPYVKSDLIVDEIPSVEKITENYKSLFDNKPKDAPVIVTGYARSDTIDALITALKMAEDAKLTRVPVSDLVD